jgi:hypothetical protein
MESLSLRQFSDETEAFDYASKLAEQYVILEGGIQRLTESEIIEALRFELDSPYCPDCGACGEDPCCSGAMCKKNKCLYGEHYAKEYQYHRHMTNRLYEALSNHDKPLCEAIDRATYDEVFNGKQYDLHSALEKVRSTIA